MTGRLGAAQESQDGQGGPVGRYSRRDAIKIGAAVGVAGLLGGSVLREALHQGRVHRVTTTRTGLGTLITLTLLDADEKRAEANIDTAFAEIERLEAILSRHRPDTPVARLNRDGRVDAPPRDLLKVLREAHDISRLTNGAFDITVAPVVALFEDQYRAGRAPSPRAVQSAGARIGFESIRMEEGRVSFDRPGMAITLDGIAKGHVVDAVVDNLLAAGYGRVLVDAGGDIGSAGSLRAGWRISVQHPRETEKSVGLISLKNGACVATSGDYMQAFNGDFSAHPIFDPRTGTSAALASSATVVAASALRADALSTAALVLGPVEGCVLVDSLPGVEALIVAKDGAVQATEGWVAVSA